MTLHDPDSANAGLCQELLHLTLDKTNDVRCSNWETLPLSVVQKAYAATDAYAALAVYQVIGPACMHPECYMNC